MKTYWYNLNDRERWMLGVGFFCCFFYLFYALLYSPLSTAVYNQSQQLSEKQLTLAWMEQVRHQHVTTKELNVLTSSKLLAVLATQLKSSSFRHFPYQLEQTGAGDIQLSFEQVPYNAFVSWVWSISGQYAFTIKQLNAERTDTPGVVKALIVLTATRS